MRLSAYSTSADLFSIGSQKCGDVYNATRTSMDFGSSFAFIEHWAVYFNVKNLTNTPHKFYQGTSERVIQREFYEQTYLLVCASTINRRLLCKSAVSSIVRWPS